ncbi:hypothetical protein RR48_03002 [Papilio machaon]|uniref:Uncharacterized protein n=1 Tax=Papilio machaon TaxID=76193 RepID=A0A0N1IGG5_PAPMA|nr:hypothetical protein RR48_03002 [Papilio machaon]
MRPKDETDAKLQTGTFILSEKIDDTKAKKSEKEMKKEMKRLEKEKQEREKREKKAREKEKEREKQGKKESLVVRIIVIKAHRVRFSYSPPEYLAPRVILGVLASPRPHSRPRDARTPGGWRVPRFTS